MIFHIGKNDLVTNKESNEIASEIPQVTKLLKLIKAKLQYQA